ncbi:DUF4965 domain-containing protein [Oscillospiraceae bacterium HV4-5-C5C]|nr:DUF4965 domain-containing protein [Oscillospiraceae bacterium HV4-5-C5C]
MERLPAYPLITCDPYFSLWSFSDRLTDEDSRHWTGQVKPLTGDLVIDGTAYRFMGTGGRPLAQQTVCVSPTRTQYHFSNELVELTLSFITPLLPQDLDLMSSPLSFADLTVINRDHKPHRIDIRWQASPRFCYNAEAAQPDQETRELLQPAMMGGQLKYASGKAAWMGRRQQPVLSHSGDYVTIDWGYLYLAVPEAAATGADETETTYGSDETPGLEARLSWKALAARQSATGFLLLAYDDIASLNYYGDLCRGYWARNGKTVMQLIEAGIREHDTIISRCQVFDQDLSALARQAGGEDYALICAAAFRQSIAAHKLIADRQGNPIFVSKECFSNGCAATVDVSYPSIPLYLIYNPELVVGMLRPILHFARQPVWPYQFAPHDAGRYPQLCGNVYGLSAAEKAVRPANGECFPPYYAYPAGQDIYDLHEQMPVEECGNLLIMAAAAARGLDLTGFIEENMDLFTQWVAYLIRYGEDPGEQLCTDDFAGHLAHNVNLAAKAVMGVEAYAYLCRQLGRTRDADAYHRMAQQQAKSWLERADRGDHTALVFDRETGWSLKYNLVWDLIWDSRLFPAALYEKETQWYLHQSNPYGVPLDSRATYTKSDWLAWAATLAPDARTRQEILRPIKNFLASSPDRVPFGDWYDTKTAQALHFRARSVQGGVFMPLLLEQSRQ